MTSTTSGNDVPIHIKWGKETIIVEVATSILRGGESVQVIRHLQSLIESKTNVPKQRQKLMCSKPKNLWKGVLKETDATVDWSVLLQSPPTQPPQFLLMGTADEALRHLEPPTTKTIFLEDMKEEEIAAMADPAGLVNLGNTCYLNSVLQCLRVIPQFQSAISSNFTAAATNAITNSNFLINTLQSTYRQLSQQTTPVQPIMFVQAIKMTFPQFAQTSPSSGHPMQQDAEEFYSSVLTHLATHLSTGTGSTGDSPIDTIFGIKFKETITCDEFTDPFTVNSSSTAGSSSEMNTIESETTMSEPPVIRYDTARKLVCNIQGGGIIPSTTNNNTTNNNVAVTATVPSSSATGSSNIPTNITFINEGIQLGLTTKIVKHSELLQRDAIWTSQQRMMKLPQVLTIQFGRFYWKLTPDSNDHTGVKCKIMKPVAFADILDVHDFCAPHIQKVLQIARQMALAAEEDAIQKKLQGKEDDAAGPVDADGDTKMEADHGNGNDANADEDEAELQKALAMSLEPVVAVTDENGEDSAVNQIVIGQGLPVDFQGYYELFAVVTHKGRDADGGHYMAWVKSSHQDNGPMEQKKIADTDVVNEDWYVFDDDEVSPCKTEDVLKLKGGGDWHMSYLNFYRAKK